MMAWENPVHQVALRGVRMDAQTRCAHYHSLFDVIALKHDCCATFSPATYAMANWPITRQRRGRRTGSMNPPCFAGSAARS